MPKFISKDSKRKVIHKLNSSNIMKSSNIEKEHVITKFKRNERKYMFYSVSFFLIIAFILIFSFCISFKRNVSLNEYSNDKFKVTYSNSSSGINNIITLTDADILEDNRIKNEDSYNFILNNSSKKTIKYQIRIRKDKELIKLDKCSNKLFTDNEIKYNINRGSIFYLSTKEEDGNYVLLEDVIKKNTSKVYSMNVWVDNRVELSEKHFHGILEVKQIN